MGLTVWGWLRVAAPRQTSAMLSCPLFDQADSGALYAARRCSRSQARTASRVTRKIRSESSRSRPGSSSAVMVAGVDMSARVAATSCALATLDMAAMVSLPSRV